MREIKLTVSPDQKDQIIERARKYGIQQVSVHAVQDPIQGRQKDEIKIKTSTPTARRLLQELLSDSSLQPLAFSSHDIQSLVSDEDIADITRPFCMPPVEVYQDFWRTCHVTFSFMVRVTVSAALLTYAMLQDREVLMIGAMLFTVFSPPLMGGGLAVALGEKRLLGHTARAFLVANLLSVAAAMLITWIVKGPQLWDRFGSFWGNVFVAAAASLVGAIADTDDAGRRQLLAIAAAFPYARFPPWIGICLVLGFPQKSIVLQRVAIFASNCGVMVAVAALTYWLLGLRRNKVLRATAVL